MEVARYFFVGGGAGGEGLGGDEDSARACFADDACDEDVLSGCGRTVEGVAFGVEEDGVGGVDAEGSEVGLVDEDGGVVAAGDGAGELDVVVDAEGLGLLHAAEGVGEGEGCDGEEERGEGCGEGEARGLEEAREEWRPGGVGGLLGWGWLAGGEVALESRPGE